MDYCHILQFIFDPYRSRIVINISKYMTFPSEKYEVCDN